MKAPLYSSLMNLLGVTARSAVEILLLLLLLQLLLLLLLPTSPCSSGCIQHTIEPLCLWCILHFVKLLTLSRGGTQSHGVYC